MLPASAGVHCCGFERLRWQEELQGRTQQPKQLVKSVRSRSSETRPESTTDAVCSDAINFHHLALRQGSIELHETSIERSLPPWMLKLRPICRSSIASGNYAAISPTLYALRASSTVPVGKPPKKSVTYGVAEPCRHAACMYTSEDLSEMEF